MKTIIIRSGSNGARILEELGKKKEELKLKLEERTELIREIGWDEYLKRSIAEGAKVVHCYEKDIQENRELDTTSMVDMENQEGL